MSEVYTMSGTKVFISRRPVRSKGDAVLADFANTDWVEIKGLENLGELGAEQTVNTRELINEVWTRKAKGTRDGGTMTNTFAPFANDEGQKLFVEQAIPSCQPYQFKIERGADCAPESDVTISVADPAVITWNDHGLFEGQPIIFTSTETMPAGLTSGTVYYVLGTGLTENAFQVSATEGGTPVETTAAGTGVITATAPPVGMTDLFQGLALDGVKSGGGKNDDYTRTLPIAVNGAIITV